jgi:hypothetical protein
MIVMGLDDGEKLFAAVVSDRPKLIVKGAMRGGREKEFTLEKDKLAHHVLKRARMGRVVSGIVKSTALIVPAKPDVL